MADAIIVYMDGSVIYVVVLICALLICQPVYNTVIHCTLTLLASSFIRPFLYILLISQNDCLF